MTATPITVTGETFDEKVLRSDKPVLVDFWADWCPPCHRLAPVLEQFAAEKADELVVAKLNIDHDPELAERYGVESIPTLNLYRDGQVVHQFVGAAPKRVLDAEFAGHL